MSTLRQRKLKSSRNSNADNNDSICPPKFHIEATHFDLCNKKTIILCVLAFLALLLYYIYQPSLNNSNQSTHKTLIQSKLLLMQERINKKLTLPLPPSPSMQENVYHREILTSSPFAQQYFDQAMTLRFAFNNDEAIRSLKTCLILDEECVMCHWAIAANYAFNINRRTTPESMQNAIKHAHIAKKLTLDHAKQYALKSSNSDLISKMYEMESLLVNAMLVQFPENRMNCSQNEYITAYSQELHKILFASEYPKIDDGIIADADILVFYAESLINQMPWDYYDQTFKPKKKTKVVYELLKRALNLNANHLFSLHLYIHIYEASVLLNTRDFKHVEIIADRLRNFMQNLDQKWIEKLGIGHLIHMPSHIYLRVGRYQDSNIVNFKAIEFAEKYFDEFGIKDAYINGEIVDNYNFYYRILYYCHRETMIIYGGFMNGQFKQSWNMINKMFENCRWSLENKSFFYENANFMDKILIRFGKFKELLEIMGDEKQAKYYRIESETNQYSKIQWEFARIFSLASVKECSKAMEIYENTFLKMVSNESVAKLKVLFRKDAPKLLKIAQFSFLGRYYDVCEDDVVKSGENWEIAAMEMDKLSYAEPPFWPINVYSCFGQMFVNHGMFLKAEKIFRIDLGWYKNNGWGLKGMMLALEGQNKENTDEYKEIEREFRIAWKLADEDIHTACY